MWTHSEPARALLQQLYDLLSSKSRSGKAKREESVLAILDRIANQGTSRFCEASVPTRNGSPSVVREAKRQLESFLGHVSGDCLFAIAREAEGEQARRCAVPAVAGRAGQGVSGIQPAKVL
jgi:hypothetical protein